MTKAELDLLDSHGVGLDFRASPAAIAGLHSTAPLRDGLMVGLYAVADGRDRAVVFDPARHSPPPLTEEFDDLAGLLRGADD